MLRLLPNTVFELYFHSKTPTSNSASDELLYFFLFDRECQFRYFSLLDCLYKVYSHGLFSLDIVDEGFYGILIFFGIIWVPICEYGILNISDVAFETLFLRGVGVPVLIPSLALVGTGPYLLIHLGFLPHGNVLDIDAHFIIMLRILPSCSL